MSLQQQQHQRDDNNGNAEDAVVLRFLTQEQQQQQQQQQQPTTTTTTLADQGDEILALTTSSVDLLTLNFSTSLSSSSPPSETVLLSAAAAATAPPEAPPQPPLQTLQPVLAAVVVSGSSPTTSFLRGGAQPATKPPALQPGSSPTQPPQQAQPAVLEQSFSILGVWILACLLFILSFILVVLVVHVIRQRHRILSILFPNHYSLYQNQSSRRNRRHAAAGSGRNNNNNNNNNDKATLARIERRYETIEGWIVSKRVVDHDEFCESCVDVFAKAAAVAAVAAAANSSTKTTLEDDSGDALVGGTTTADDDSNKVVDKDADAVEFGMHTKAKQLERLQKAAAAGDIEQGAAGCTTAIKHLETCSTQDEDDDEDYSIQQAARECPICFEEFRVGQVISFSANPECCHVFHHECIKEWLLRHINCPFCRKVCMHVDEYRNTNNPGRVNNNNNMKTKPHVIQELLDKHSKRSATTYYCVRDGLVVIPPKVRCTKRELKQLKHRICDCIVDRQELATLRGSRPEASVTTNTQTMLREINLTETTTTTTDPTEAILTATGGDPTRILGIANHADDGNEQSTAAPSSGDEALAGVQQLTNLHHQASATEPSRPIILLEMASVEDENDYDPTERDGEGDDLNVFPQRQLDDASVSEHITLERDDDDDDDDDDSTNSSTDSSSTVSSAAKKEITHSDNNNGPPPRRGVGAASSSSSLSRMMLGRHQQQQQYDNNSTRTAGTSTDDDEEMLLQEVEDVSCFDNNDNTNNDDCHDDDHDECNAIVQGNGEDDDCYDESHHSNVEAKTVTATTRRRVSLSDDMIEVNI